MGWDFLYTSENERIFVLLCGIKESHLFWLSHLFLASLPRKKHLTDSIDHKPKAHLAYSL
jgi:hypothetical protein